MRVLIAVPTFESITPDTFKALWDMDKGGHDCDFEFVRGYDCATARNSIVQKTIDGGYDLLMMVDSDVTPPRSALVDLMSHDVGFASGFYVRRSDENDGLTCAYRLFDENGRENFNYTLESAYTRDDMAEMRGRGEYLVEIHGCGMGCVLISRETLESLSYPWFDWVNYRDGKRSMLSEDLFFCEKLVSAGIPRYADSRVACGHLFRRIEEAI